MKKRIFSSILITLLVLSSGQLAASAAPAVVLSGQSLAADGKTVACEKYNIDGSNYFKLRDIASILSGTGSQFSVSWDEAANTVTVETGKAYAPAGGELDASGPDNSPTAVPSGQKVTIDGTEAADIPAYNIGGYNFFRLRDLGAALGFGVDYDAASDTMLVTSSASVAVSTAAELLNAIAPNRKITLAAGEYDLSSVNISQVQNDYVSWETVFDGTELVITGVANCAISGAGAGSTSLAVKPRYADVLTFTGCSGIKITGLTAGHTPEPGDCVGGVLNFIFTDHIAVSSCVLYGCGTYGVIMDGVKGLTVRDTEIRDCTYGIATAAVSSSVTFDNCRFHDCHGYGPLTFDNCNNIAFTGCTIENNSGWDNFIFISVCDTVTFTECTIAGNSADSFVKVFNSNAVSFKDNDIRDNAFPKGIVAEGSETNIDFSPALG